MTDLINPDQGILFMKVGVHAKEPLESIIERKSREIEEAGFALWGYGGNTCHPTTMVQPFARKFSDEKGGIILCMHEMDSKHFAEQVRAEYFSIDGQKWEYVPQQINVMGSRFALAIKALRQEEFTLPLARTRVAIGNSQGRPGDQYIAGRVDKACLELSENAAGPLDPEEPKIQISLVADLCDPYAVFLKN
ncbi:MAG: hypothetical protein KZQ91_05040 [Candidatus Thiodiazotropha sp. (ex Lucinoma borealis)]|nr:hypothetical protein [Candidatus Thiodiazotropha sp. (ex Lucinoma borealis)]